MPPEESKHEYLTYGEAHYDPKTKTLIIINRNIHCRICARKMVNDFITATGGELTPEQ